VGLRRLSERIRAWYFPGKRRAAAPRLTVQNQHELSEDRFHALLSLPAPKPNATPAKEQLFLFANESTSYIILPQLNSWDDTRA
jgi:hypothetical protein